MTVLKRYIMTLFSYLNIDIGINADVAIYRHLLCMVA